MSRYEKARQYIEGEQDSGKLRVAEAMAPLVREGEILDQIQRGIAEGRYPPGTRLDDFSEAASIRAGKASLPSGV